MKMRFIVRSVQQEWKPPFKKDIKEDEFAVKEGEGFDQIIGNGNNTHVFKAIKLNGDSATIEYSKLFTLKTGNPGNYQVTLKKDESIAMTYLWGENGTTKTVTYKGIAAESGF